MPLDVVRRIIDPLRQPVVTSRFPAAPALLQPATRRLPMVDPGRCERDGACAAACPTAAITLDPAAWTIDAGLCVLCGACADACPSGAISMIVGSTTPPVREREALVTTIALEPRP